MLTELQVRLVRPALLALRALLVLMVLQEQPAQPGLQEPMGQAVPQAPRELSEQAVLLVPLAFQEQQV